MKAEADLSREAAAESLHPEPKLEAAAESLQSEPRLEPAGEEHAAPTATPAAEPSMGACTLGPITDNGDRQPDPNKQPPQERAALTATPEPSGKALPLLAAAESLQPEPRVEQAVEEHAVANAPPEPSREACTLAPAVGDRQPASADPRIQPAQEQAAPSAPPEPSGEALTLLAAVGVQQPELTTEPMQQHATPPGPGYPESSREHLPLSAAVAIGVYQTQPTSEPIRLQVATIPSLTPEQPRATRASSAFDCLADHFKCETPLVP